ncbi:MAG: sugar phosphate isomerase/epimerase [Armatimonadetes bacterium]|nr:sugar phosphate isomerase/epimerase [Armatimonadota bacterium]
MKLGISMWSYVAAARRGLDIPGFIREAHRLGVEGVELLDFFWKDREAELPAVEAALGETGLAMGVYSVSNNFAQDDPAQRAAQVQVIRDGVDSAVHFGARTVRVFAGDVRPGLTFQQVFDWIVAGLREAADYAHGKGVTLALENHGTLAGRSNQVADILDAVGSPALRANPDTGNFLLVHQAPHEAVARLAPRAGMVHFKDFRAVPDDYAGFAYTSIDGVKFTGQAIGEGEVDLPDCLLSLKAAGFDGWLNIEYEAEEDPFTGVARSVANTQRLLTEAGLRA